ncbi:hypothetical protein OG742_03040 [Streptomyces sp. NBC_00828]|uniref:hypothetical protein n=1 Tax=Streptomyces sp. NBC_00828 TaxID=2903678 RepID=UPI003867EA70
MHELLWVTGLAGAVLCLAGHLPGPVRRWGPHAVAAAAMTAAAPGAGSRELLLASAATAAACAWNAVAGCARRSADLAVMTVLTAAMVPAHLHASGPWLPVFFLACWAVVRSGTALFRRVWLNSPARQGHSSTRTVLLGETGGLLMIAGMAGMFG